MTETRAGLQDARTAEVLLEVVGRVEDRHPAGDFAPRRGERVHAVLRSEHLIGVGGHTALAKRAHERQIAFGVEDRSQV
jgi:hypothetical protein